MLKMGYKLAAERIIKDYLHMQPGERFFILTDSRAGFPARLARACLEEAENQDIRARLAKQKQISFGKPDRVTVRMLKSLKKNDCLFACLNGNTGSIYSALGKSFRMLLRTSGVRFGTMVGLAGLKEPRAILEAIVNGAENMGQGRKLKEALDSGHELAVTGKLGTKLTCSIEGRRAWANMGEFSRAGSGGNIPAGNVNIFPLEGTVNGTALVDISVKVENKTVNVKEPVKFLIENGEIVSIEGKKELVHALNNDLNNFSYINSRQGLDPRAIFKVGEIGFGLLKGKPIGLNLMDEKLLGTCHIANGNTWGKGGRIKCRGHRVHLFGLDKLKIDGKRFRI